jgi:hypothetical protein
MSNKLLNIEPIALTGSIANLLNGAITSLAGPVGFTATQPRIIIKHMRIINPTGSPIVVILYKGATGASAAGSEFAWNNYSLSADGAGNVNYDDWYGEAPFDSTDFLTGKGNGATLNIDAEIQFS